MHLFVNRIQAARMEEVNSECSNSLPTRSEKPQVVLETRLLDDTPIQMVDGENTLNFSLVIWTPLMNRDRIVTLYHVKIDTRNIKELLPGEPACAVGVGGRPACGSCARSNRKTPQRTRARARAAAQVWTGAGGQNCYTVHCTFNQVKHNDHKYLVKKGRWIRYSGQSTTSSR